MMTQHAELHQSTSFPNFLKMTQHADNARQISTQAARNRAFTLLEAFCHFASTHMHHPYTIEEPGAGLHGFMEFTSDHEEEIEVTVLELLPFNENNIHSLVRAVREVFLSGEPALRGFQQITFHVADTFGLLPDRSSPPEYTTRVLALLNEWGFRGMIPGSNGSEETQPLDAARVSQYSHYFITRPVVMTLAQIEDMQE